MELIETSQIGSLNAKKIVTVMTLKSKKKSLIEIGNFYSSVKEQYEKIKAIREGKGSGTQNIYNDQNLLKSDLEDLQKQKEELNQKFNNVSPTDPNRDRYRKEIDEIDRKIETSQEIIARNEKKMRDMEKLERVDDKGRKQIDLYRQGIKDLEEKQKNNHVECLSRLMLPRINHLSTLSSMFLKWM